MQKLKYKAKKIFIIQMIFVIVFAMILNMTVMTSEVKAVQQSKKEGIDAFPESYKAGLRALKANHPNWNFIAFNTGLTWQEFMNAENEHIESTPSKAKRNLVKTTKGPWKCACNRNGGSGYMCASDGIIAYYADPRNFLSETGIYQFMEMTYNQSTQNKASLQQVLKNSFMNGSVEISGEREDTTIKAKQENQYIIVAPGTKNTEVATAINMTRFRVTDANNKAVSNDSVAATGHKFINTEYNTTYTMVVLGDVNGDGLIKSTDYARIKSYIMQQGTLSDLEKKAADVNRDGNVKSTDYARIKNYIMTGAPITLSEKTSGSSTMSYADIIMKAAEESDISPYHIAMKIFQEVGKTNPSQAVTGNYPGLEGYYNFFNWNATDSSGIRGGLEYAKSQGWNNQYIAIIEGAKKMADSYTATGQNTQYFYKFDVVDDSSNHLYWHQYMTNIQDPSNQSNMIFNDLYDVFKDVAVNFIIPVFNNMPQSACSLPGASENAWVITGTGVRFRETPNGSAKATLSQWEELERIGNEEVSAGGYIWYKFKRGNDIGWVAIDSEWIKKCN